MAGRQLPDAELEVLACLHRLGQATARQLRAALKTQRPMAHASVLTLLSRLEAKGLVSREKMPVGKAFLFRPTHPPERTYRRVLEDLVERVFGGSGVKLIASLFETRAPSDEELAEIQDLLKKLKRKGRR